MIPTCQYTGPDRSVPVCGKPASHLFGSYHICFEHVADANQSEPYADPCSPILPYVGMLGTFTAGSDRYPCTVVYVSKGGAKIIVREDRAIRTDNNGMSETQEYVYEANLAGTLRTFWRREDGYGTHGRYLHLGFQRAYYDFSF